MAVIKDTNKRGRIGPSMRGQFYSYEKNGGLVLAKWPEKRGKPRSEAQADAQRLFIEACAAMKRMDSAFIEYARLNSKGTPMLPRDALMAALYGRGPVIILPNGEKRYPMASRIDMSMLLDNLADKDGMILFRGNDDLWIGLPIGDAGQVLTVDNDGLLPQWKTPSAAVGGGGVWLLQQPTTISSSGYASKGVIFTPLADQNITGVAIRHQAPAGGTYALGVYEVDDSGYITAVRYDAPIDFVRDGTARSFYFQFPASISAPRDVNYAIYLRRTDASDTTSVQLFQGSTLTQGIPLARSYWYSRIAKKNPVVGDLVDTSTGGPMSISVGL